MSYDFSFDRKSVWALLAGSLVLGVLLFVAGVLVGGNWGEKTSAEQAESGKSKTDASADGETAAGPKVRQAPVAGEPVLMHEPLAPVADLPPVAAGPGVGAPPLSAPNATAPGVTFGPQGLPAPRVPPAAAAPPAESFREESQRSYPPPRDPDPKLVQEAETETPDEAAQSPATSKGIAYAVQVGDYQEEKGARRLAAELENKGYTPSIFRGRDAENRIWYAVRIGTYVGAKDATQAAANFTRQEKLKATVRPVNSF